MSNNESNEISQFLIFLFVLYMLPTLWSYLIDNKIRYSFQYDAGFSDIYIKREPRDCEFLAAPIGLKPCEYEKDVSVEKYSISTTGNPIVSFDGGKNWVIASSGQNKGSIVYVTWHKVDK